MAFKLGGASGFASFLKKDVNDKDAEKKLTEKKETNGLFSRMNQLTTGMFNEKNVEEKPVAGTSAEASIDEAQKKAAAGEAPASAVDDAKGAEDAKKTAEAEAAALRTEILLTAYEKQFGKRPVSKWDGKPFLTDEQLEQALKNQGLSDNDINNMASEVMLKEPSAFEKAAASVSDGIDKATTAIGDTVDWIEDKVDSAQSFLEDTVAEANGLAADLNSKLMGLPYVGKALSAFKCNFCAHQPFPQCISCPHRQAMTNDRGFDLFRQIADIRESIKKGIFDLANSLFDCPGMAAAISNGDFGVIKGAVVNHGLSSLLETGVELGAANVFSGLANLSPNNEKWVGGIEFLDDLIQGHSAAIAKSIRTGDWDLIDGAYKLKNIQVSDFFEVSWGDRAGVKAVGFKGGNVTVPAWKGYKDFSLYEVASIPSTSREVGTSKLEEAINRANAEADAIVSKTSSELAKLEEETATRLSSTVREAINSDNPDEVVGAISSVNPADKETTVKEIQDSAIESIASGGSSIAGSSDNSGLSADDISKAVVEKLASGGSANAPTTVTNKKTVVNLQGILTNGSRMPAAMMADFNGNKASLHSLKLAYGAAFRIHGTVTPPDVDYKIIKTRSDSLFV